MINGISETNILVLKVFMPATMSIKIIVLKQANPVRVKTLPGFC